LPLSLLIILLAFFLPPDSLGVALAGGLVRWVLIGLAILLVVLALALRRPGDPAADPAGRTLGTNRRRWALFGSILFLIGLGNVAVMQSSFLVSSDDERGLYRFLETLPVDVLVSGSPCDLDGVPLFARRMIVTSCEQPRSGRLLMEALLAYYAAEVESVGAYCQLRGVDYLVLNKRSFEQQALQDGDYFFEPYNSYLQQVIGGQQVFALPAIAEEKSVFENETFAVVPCADMQPASDGMTE
jgi:hypothetical protein